MRISAIDISAGFDILSYFSNEINDEKYIEVKNCDRNYTFYISENEVEVARQKQDRYFLYLYNRTNKTVREIQNPYKYFFEESKENWIVQPEKYKIHEI